MPANPVPRQSTVGTAAALHEEHVPVTIDAGLTLQAVLQEAFRRYPDLVSAEARAREAQALEERSRSWIAGAPTASVRYQTDRLGGPEILGDNVGLREIEPLVTVPLWRPGQRRQIASMGEAAGEASEAATTALALRVASELRELLWDLDELDRAVEVADAAAAAAHRRSLAVRRSVELGDLARTDALLADREALERDRAAVELRARLVDAWFAYRTLTGMARRPAAAPEIPADLDTVALEAHPRYALADAERQRSAAAAENAAMTARGQPTLTLGPRSERSRQGADPDDSFGVILSVPFGGGSHVRARQAQAERSAADAAAAVARVRRALEMARHEAEHELDVAGQQLALARTRSDAASEYATLARSAFARGEFSLLELLRSEAAELDARLELIRRESAYGLAVARLNQAAGVLP